MYGLGLTGTTTVDLGVMAMKEYSTLTKTPGLLPRQQIFWEGLTLCREFSEHIINPADRVRHSVRIKLTTW